MEGYPSSATTFSLFFFSAANPHSPLRSPSTDGRRLLFIAEMPSATVSNANRRHTKWFWKVANTVAVSAARGRRTGWWAWGV